MTTRNAARSTLTSLVAVALVTTAAAGQTPPPSKTASTVVPWSPERVREFVVTTYPTILTGDTIGHVNILLDQNGQFVRSTSGRMDSVRVYLAGDGPSTGRADGFRISRSLTGQTSIDPISGPLVKTTYGLDDIDPTLLNAAHVYGFRAGEVGPHKFVATVLVMKPRRNATP